MRYYGSEYAKSLTGSITRAKGSVDSTGYSSVISSTTVKPSYSGLKSECIGAANRAYGNVSNVRDKLGTLNTKLTSFYNEVDSTAEEVNNTALTVKQVLSSINTSLKNMHDLLGGTGSFKGKTATAASINQACSSLASGADALTKHYAKKFTNPDGSLNMDAVKEFCNEYDIKIEEGIELKDAYVVNGFVEATKKRLDACKTDEEFTEVVNELLKVFYVQDKSTPSIWERGYEHNWEDGPDGYMKETTWFNYQFRPSASLFTVFLNQNVQANIESKGLKEYFESNPNSVRFRDAMIVINDNFKQISCPVYDTDEYEAYKEKHYTPNGDDFANDSVTVDMPFNGFKFTTIVDESVPGQPVTYTRMTFDGFGDEENKLGFNTITKVNGEYYAITGGAYSVDICSCNTNMTDFTKKVLVDNAYAFAESTRVGTDELVAQTLFDLTTTGFFAVTGIDKIPGIDLLWGFMGNVEAAKAANYAATEYQAGLTNDAKSYDYYTNLGGVTGSYYIIGRQFIGSDDQTRPVPITITSDPIETGVILGYNSGLNSDHLVVVGTKEADEWLKERDLITDGREFNEYSRSFYTFLSKDKKVDYKTLSASELAKYIKEFNEIYFK